MKKTFKFFLMIFATIVGTSCSAGSNESKVSFDSTAQTTRKYEVTLTSTNFNDFFDVTATLKDKSNMSPGYWNIKIEGCLSYAFYESCLATVAKHCSSQADELYTISLNAAGNGEINTVTTKGDAGTIDVTSIVGKVTYII